MSFVFLSGKLFREVIDATIFGSFLALVALASQYAGGRRIAPAWKYALWLVVLVRLVIPEFPESRWSIFNAPNWFRASTPPQRRVTVTLGEPVRSTEGNPIYFESSTAALPVVPVEPSALKPEIRTWDILGVCWLSISALILLRFGIGSCWLRVRLARDKGEVDPVVARILSQTRARMRTRWNPRPVETSCVDSPALFGCLRPKLLLPRGIASELSEAELHHVFSHELAHLKRGDLWTNLLMSIVQALHWFNPIVWFVLRRMRLERELACDALVLRSRPVEETRSYGETIVKLLERIALRPRFPVVVGILEEKQSAASRLIQIAQFGSKRRPSQRLGIVLAMLFAVMGWSNAQAPKPVSSQTPESTTPRVDGTTSAEKDPDKSVTEDLEALRRLHARQKALVEKSRHELESLREQLKITESAEELGADWEAKRIERDRIAAEARYLYFKQLVDQLKRKDREELRRVIPTCCSDVAMDRYLGDLAKVEQTYASRINNLGPKHPEIVNLVEAMKTINRQIEDRIDGVLAGLDLEVTQCGALVKELRKRLDVLKKSETQKNEVYEPYFDAKRKLERQEQGLDYLQAEIDQAPGSPANETPVPAPSRQTSTLIQDARLLMELGKLDEAKEKLSEALQADPEHRAAWYYLKLIKERQYNIEARKREQAADPLNFLDLLRLPSGEPPTANPYATTNRIYSSAGRANVARKLREITLPKWSVKRGTRLSEAVKELAREARARDPQNIGINFLIGSLGTDDDSRELGEFTVEQNLEFEDIRLIDVLAGLLERVHPPENRNSGRKVAFAIEDYAVVFNEQQAAVDEVLYTRTFKVNPNAFIQGLYGVLLTQNPFTEYVNPSGESGGEPTSFGPGGHFKFPERGTTPAQSGGIVGVRPMNSELSIQEAVRNFFLAAGLNFPTNVQSSAANSSPPRKAIFFNDHTGVLMVRGTLADLDTVENALHALSVAPPQVMIDSAVVEIKPGAAYEQDLLLRIIATNKSQGVVTISGILTDPQFKGLVNALDGRKNQDPDPSEAKIGILTEIDFRKVFAELKNAKGVSILATPKITTVSGRPARIAIEPGPSVDVLATVERDGTAIELATTVEVPQQNGKLPPLKGTANGRVWDNQTLVIHFPGNKGHTTIIFVTPTIIDPAGNRVHTQENPPRDIPAQSEK